MRENLYHRLLTLGPEDRLASFLQDALALVAELAGAEDRGDLELRGQHVYEE